MAIRIQDSGPGVDPDDVALIFEPFYRGKNARSEGSGLGLSISKRFVEAHGSALTVGRGREGGAVFELTLDARVADTTPPSCRGPRQEAAITE